MRGQDFALRLLSGIAGVFVIVASALITLGTSLAAPLGIFVARRLARRNGRPLTRFGSWFSAATASSIAVLLALAALLGVNAQKTLREIQQASAAASARDTAPLPAWLTRAFPQAAHPDPVAQKIIRSPAFTAFTFMAGVVITAATLGTIGGSVGWAGTMLVSYALRGRRGVSQGP